MRWLRPGPWPTSFLILFLGVFAVGLAWATLDLFRLAMASADFLLRDGLVAVMHGGLVQAGLLAGKAMLALFFYLAFKVVESELVARWAGRK